MSSELLPPARSGVPDIEPTVLAEVLGRAISPGEVEGLRPLLPVGYEAGVRAYRAAAAGLEVADLTEHYTRGLREFHDELVPAVRRRLEALTGGAWSLAGHEAYAAGSDVDLMAHVVEAAVGREGVVVYPGDWYGFSVGSTRSEQVGWSADGQGKLACVCVPSVRNGHLGDAAAAFLDGAGGCLLNINLFPTMPAAERRAVAERLAPVLGKSIVSVSFSRGFGLTASQLGVAFVPPGHMLAERLRRPLRWFTYFHNALAARAFLAIDAAELARVDEQRRAWVLGWLRSRGLPAVETGTYYVRSFQALGRLPEHLAPLVRSEASAPGVSLVRLCFKPPLA
jgi:hypothetical protein